MRQSHQLAGVSLVLAALFFSAPAEAQLPRFGEVSLTYFNPVGDQNFGLTGAQEFVPAVGLSFSGGRHLGPIDVGLRADIAVGGLDSSAWESALSNFSGQDVALDPGVLWNVALLGRFHAVHTPRLRVYVGAEVGFIAMSAALSDSEVCSVDALTGEVLQCTQEDGVTYFGLSGALSTGASIKIAPRVFVGAELRYVNGTWLSRSFDDGFGAIASSDVSEMSLDFISMSASLRINL